jgi:ferredoxin-NADP reductase
VAEVREIVVETPRVKTLILHVPDWPGHLPGQHVDIRLTAEDGYQAQRSYSIASPPEDPLLSLTVELVDNGEVSHYLVDELRPGDKFELRGPIGGHFVWTVATGGPLFLIAGGSGIAPLMSMLRHRQRRASHIPAALLYSSRSFEDIIFRAELDAMARGDACLRIVNTLTRRRPEGWTGQDRRIDKAMLAEFGFAPRELAHTFVCGSNSLVEAVSAALVGLGHDPLRIKTERFGPSG